MASLAGCCPWTWAACQSKGETGETSQNCDGDVHASERLFLAATIICHDHYVYFLDKVKEEDRDQTEIHSFLIIARNVVFIVSVMEIKEKWRGIGWSVGSRPNQQVLVSLQ